MRAFGTCLLLVGALLASGIASSAQVYTSPFAGQWFPADRQELSDLLDRSFDTAEARASGVARREGLRALVVPHAALRYSGVIGASAYRLLDNSQNVIVLAISHRKPVPGVVSVNANAYATPLGEVAINREVQAELGFPLSEPEEYSDHSLEVQLPLLQRAAPGASIVPLYVGGLSDRQRAEAAAKLAKRLVRGDAIVASSDFTHYGETYGYTPFPHDEQTGARLRSQAAVAFEEIGSLDPQLFKRYLQQTGDTICGRDPILLLMATLSRLKEQHYMELADFLTSADLTGDYAASVSYGALAFYPARSYRIDEDAQEKLLVSARATIDDYLSGKKTGVHVPEAERTAGLEQRNGVFVTVRSKGELRGCVGAYAPRTPLWETVPDRTIASISTDPRFAPLTAEEGEVTIEVSVLTPVRRVRDWRRFRLGFGAILLYEGKSSTLLPQVAEETGWDRRAFLENLALKAGLEKDAYRDADARLYTYEAQVFAEPAAAASHADGHATPPWQ